MGYRTLTLTAWRRCQSHALLTVIAWELTVELDGRACAPRPHRLGAIMLKWIINVAVVVGVGYPAYDYLKGGFHTRPAMRKTRSPCPTRMGFALSLSASPTCGQSGNISGSLQSSILVRSRLVILPKAIARRED